MGDRLGAGLDGVRHLDRATGLGAWTPTAAGVRCTCPSPTSRLRVAGVLIDALSFSEALRRIGDFLNCDGTHVVHHLSADPIVQAMDDPALREALEHSDLNLPDGMGVVWGARASGARRLKRRVYGPELMEAVLQSGLGRDLQHAFVGGSPAGLEALKRRLAARFPRMRVAGAHAPPFREVTPAAVVEDLERLGAESDVLWIGLGTPKQQLWAHYARRFRPARVIATVGAAFDFLAGLKPQAPRWIGERGLEWAFRLATEPRRLWRRYLLGNPRFVWAVARERLAR